MYADRTHTCDDLCAAHAGPDAVKTSLEWQQPPRIVFAYPERCWRQH